MTANQSPQELSAAPDTVLRWHERLQFKLGLLFTLLLVLALTGAAISSKLLLHRDLVEDSFRAEREAGLRLALQLDQIAAQAEQTARSLARSTLALQGQTDALRNLVPALLAQSDASLIGAAGIWPEPPAIQGSPRNSLLWLRGNDASLQLRGDYNDPRVAPYWREAWYTPARYVQAERCYWSLIASDPLYRAPMLQCSLPMLDGRRFAGVVSVSLPLSKLLSEFERIARGDVGYALLLDDNDRLLAASPALAGKLDQGKVENLAGLAQKFPAYNPLALRMHARGEELQAAFAGSALAAAAKALQTGSRDMSLAEARDALLRIWLAEQPSKRLGAETGLLRIDDDPVFDGPGDASLFEMRQGWRLLRLSSASAGFAGADALFLRALAILGAAVALLLLLAYAGLRWLVLRPVSRMAAQMSQSFNAGDTPSLLSGENANNELGLFAHWHNERLRQLRDLMEQNLATNSQLVGEAGERRNLQEALQRLQERHSLALQGLEEAVIAIDDKGRVEDLNPAAERLTGFSLKAARGRPFGEIFNARIVEQKEPLPDLARTTMERGTRLDYPDNLVLTHRSGVEKTVGASIAPMRSRSNRISGAVIVFRERGSVAVAAPASPAAPATPSRGTQKDPLTGLPMRHACERRVRELIDAAKLSPRTHALVTLDVDQLTRVNDSGSQAAGDAVLTRLSELLINLSGSAGEVYRLSSDHFAILLGNSSTDRARTFAEALRRTIVSTRFVWEGRQYNVTTSLGVTDFNGQSDSAAEVLRRAEEACNAAKRAGRNSVKVYDDSMSRFRPAVDDGVWVRRIRAGIDQGLLHLTTQLVQPQPSAQAEGQVFDLQLALEDEEGFWTPAAGFMPAAERQHLAGELDRWALQRLLDQLNLQPRVIEELGFVIVTLSAPSLADPRLPVEIASLLARHPAVEPRKLCLAVQQQVLLEHPQLASAFVESIRSLGCRVMIDGFSPRGTGELSLLRRWPVEALRLDAAGFPTLTSDALEQGLAEAAVKLAHAMDRRLAVANLDDARQAEAWRRLGADYLQGNALARASPVIFAAPERR
jgi:diguanylate cyclase (GGDEF)-like protein/PAS domain S-box-containing protein